MCERRKIKNASSVLRHLASIWWESLSSSDKPHTWNDMKILMRETFVNPSLVINPYDEEHQLDQSPIIPPVVPNLLQDNAQKSGDDMTEMRCSQSHVKIQHVILPLTVRAKVMQMMLISQKMRVLLMC
jgi:hypothetical protein